MIRIRPTWDEYFMSMVDLARTRSTCIRRNVGALIVKDRMIIATGYNGPPTGQAHCEDTGCLREQLDLPSGERHEICRGLHAEQNALAQAAMRGASVKDATIYISHSPCNICAKMLVNAGIAEIVFVGDYPDPYAKEVLEQSSIIVRQII